MDSYAEAIGYKSSKNKTAFWHMRQDFLKQMRYVEEKSMFKANALNAIPINVVDSTTIMKFIKNVKARLRGVKDSSKKKQIYKSSLKLFWDLDVHLFRWMDQTVVFYFKEFKEKTRTETIEVLPDFNEKVTKPFLLKRARGRAAT